MATSKADSPLQTASPTPAALGFSMPAEWEKHRATWLSWPHNRDTWPGKFDAIEPAFVSLVAALTESEPVFINVLDTDHEQHVRRFIGQRIAGVKFVTVPTNDAWCRDHGATFVTRKNAQGVTELGAVDWQYNGWGGKYPPFDLDSNAAGRIATHVGAHIFSSELYLEGGAIDVNGRGTVMTTESCVLNENRNPGRARTDVEHELRQMLGVNRVLWLPGGDVEGDDTDGHIDNIARFVSEETIVVAAEPDPADPNHKPLQENRRYLELEASTDNTPMQIVDLPGPSMVEFEGRRLPASYANFYVANTAVIVPVYRCPADARALEILQNVFPSRRVVGVDCTDIIWGLGAVHCLTQQLPG